LGAIPGVEVVGSVPDVRPYVASAPVAVAPLWIARGIQNKVLEAMAMARAVVASPDALVGLKAQPGRHLLRATNPQEWFDTIWWLWSDTSLAAAFGTAARRFVEQHHRWDNCLEPFAPLLNLPAAPNGVPAPSNGSHLALPPAQAFSPLAPSSGRGVGGEGLAGARTSNGDTPTPRARPVAV
jgi:hypothetical protein